MLFFIINNCDYLFNCINLFNCYFVIENLVIFNNLFNFFGFGSSYFLEFFLKKYIYLNSSLIYSLKFTLTILFLIFIRAGIPRYRYDYLTFLGWNRFLFISILVFSLVIFIYIFV